MHQLTETSIERYTSDFRIYCDANLRIRIRALDHLFLTIGNWAPFQDL